MSSKSTSFTCQQADYFDTYVSANPLAAHNHQTIAEKTEFDTLLKCLPDLSGKTVLDLGCGYGRNSLRLAQHAQHVVGIDVSPKSIEIANQTAKKLDITNFKGVVSDFRNVKKYQNRFDVIVTVNTFHHIDDLNLILTNLRSSLKKNGILLLFEFNPFNPLFIPFLIKIGQLKSHLNQEYLRSNLFTLKKYLIQNGFDIKQVINYAFLPTSLYNYTTFFKQVNDYLNKIPVINQFTAYHIVTCQ